MNSSALESYLASVDPAVAPLVVALDEAVRNAFAGFDSIVKYKILMYTLGGD